MFITHERTIVSKVKFLLIDHSLVVFIDPKDNRLVSFDIFCGSVNSFIILVGIAMKNYSLINWQSDSKSFSLVSIKFEKIIVECKQLMFKFLFLFFILFTLLRILYISFAQLLLNLCILLSILHLLLVLVLDFFLHNLSVVLSGLIL